MRSLRSNASAIEVTIPEPMSVLTRQEERKKKKLLLGAASVPKGPGWFALLSAKLIRNGRNRIKHSTIHIQWPLLQWKQQRITNKQIKYLPQSRQTIPEFNHWRCTGQEGSTLSIVNGHIPGNMVHQEGTTGEGKIRAATSPSQPKPQYVEGWKVRE